MMTRINFWLQSEESGRSAGAVLATYMRRPPTKTIEEEEDGAHIDWRLTHLITDTLNVVPLCACVFTDRHGHTRTFDRSKLVHGLDKCEWTASAWDGRERKKGSKRM